MAKNYIKPEQIYEGKAKKLYSLQGEKNLLFHEFKDDATAFNAQKRGTILNKGKINKKLKPFFKHHGLKLVDLKLEFEKAKNGKILLGDEITPDTCRIWDTETNQKPDKDRFRFSPGGVNEAYEEVSSRILKNQDY